MLECVDMRMMRRVCVVALAGVLLLGGVGCSSAYYGMWEKMGYHKRDLLAENIEEAQEKQEEAQEQFKSAVDRLLVLVNGTDIDLAQEYERLSAELERSESRAEAVRDKIGDVEEIAGDLFEEWEAELEQYQSQELRAASERQLRETRNSYGQLIDVMKRAESKMEPVLVVFRDQVLFLKHNLNARAVVSLRGTAHELETDVAALIGDMQQSIREADEFLKGLGVE